MKRALLLVGAVIFSGACATTPWGMGVEQSEAAAVSAVPNGIVVVLGPETWATAGARLTSDVVQTHTKGVNVAGQVSVSGVSVGLDTLDVSWPGVASVHAVSLGAASHGIDVTLQVTLPTTVVEVALEGGTLCSMTLGVEGSLFTGLGLGQDKYGAIRSHVLDNHFLVVQDQTGLTQQCAFALGPDMTGQVVTAVLDDIREALVMSLAPYVEHAVPQALGLDLTMETSTTVGGDSIGSGHAVWRVQSPSGQTISLWNDADDQLVVPFSVALDVQRHPCVPAYKLPHVAAQAVPTASGDIDPVMWVNAKLAEKAFHVAWQTGSMCGDRPTQLFDVEADAVRQAWPALSALPNETALSLRVWPRGEPSIIFSDDGGTAWVNMDSGEIRVEIIGHLHGTWLELASMDVNLTLGGPLTVTASMNLGISPDVIQVHAAQTRAGLISQPEGAVAQALMAPMIKQLFEAPLLSLPPLAIADPAVDVGFQDGYLLFHVVSPNEE